MSTPQARTPEASTPAAPGESSNSNSVPDTITPPPTHPPAEPVFADSPNTIRRARLAFKILLIIFTLFLIALAGMWYKTVYQKPKLTAPESPQTFKIVLPAPSPTTPP